MHILHCHNYTQYIGRDNVDSKSERWESETSVHRYRSRFVGVCVAVCVAEYFWQCVLQCALHISSVRDQLS